MMPPHCYDDTAPPYRRGALVLCGSSSVSNPIRSAESHLLFVLVLLILVTHLKQSGSGPAGVDAGIVIGGLGREAAGACLGPAAS